MAGIRKELGEKIPEYERLHVSGADDDVFEGLGVVNGVVQSLLQLVGEGGGEGVGCNLWEHATWQRHCIDLPKRLCTVLPPGGSEQPHQQL